MCAKSINDCGFGHVALELALSIHGALTVFSGIVLDPAEESALFHARKTS